MADTGDEVITGLNDTVTLIQAVFINSSSRLLKRFPEFLSSNVFSWIFGAVHNDLKTYGMVIIPRLHMLNSQDRSRC